MTPRKAKKCWQELIPTTVDRVAGDGTKWPLAAMTRQEIHYWQKLIRNLRIYGNVTPFGEAMLEFDFKLSELVDFGTPTELSRLTMPGLTAFKLLDDPNPNGVLLDIAIGRDFFSPTEKIPVLLDGSNRYLPFWFQVDSTDGDTGHASTDSTAFPSAITCTFASNAVALYDNATAGSPTGDITIEVPTGVGDAAFLEWDGLRDPDTGEFNIKTF